MLGKKPVINKQLQKTVSDYQEDEDASASAERKVFTITSIQNQVN